MEFIKFIGRSDNKKREFFISLNDICCIYDRSIITKTEIIDNYIFDYIDCPEGFVKLYGSKSEKKFSYIRLESINHIEFPINSNLEKTFIYLKSSVSANSVTLPKEYSDLLKKIIYDKKLIKNEENDYLIVENEKKDLESNNESNNDDIYLIMETNIKSFIDFITLSEKYYNSLKEYIDFTKIFDKFIVDCYIKDLLYDRQIIKDKYSKVDFDSDTGNIKFYAKVKHRSEYRLIINKDGEHAILSNNMTYVGFNDLPKYIQNYFKDLNDN